MAKALELASQASMRVIDRKNNKQGCEFKRIQQDHDHYSWTREQTEGNSIQVYVEELKS